MALERSSPAAEDGREDTILTRHEIMTKPIFLAVALILPVLPLQAADGLERLKYNHPGLTVDLGVGLWAWPLPMDFDGDGDLDLVVNCPDKPYNGVYFFENPGGKFPVFKPAKRISRGLQNVQVSYVDGKPRVLSPGLEYPNFLKSGLKQGVKLPVAANVHPNKVRANMWRYVDYDADGKLDLIVGAGDWTDYGWTTPTTRAASGPPAPCAASSTSSAIPAPATSQAMRSPRR
jgi:hypothetical protein